MNGTVIQTFLAFLSLQKILGNFCFSEQIFQRKQSFGAPQITYTFFFVIYFIFSLQINIFVLVACLLERNCRMCLWVLNHPRQSYSLLHNKNQTNLFLVMYGLANIDISSLMNLSQKLIFLTVSQNNKPKQRH